MQQLPLIEIHVVHHCNLNCIGCAHFAPLAKPPFWYATADDVTAALHTLVDIGHVYPERLRLFGGEPTLNPSLGEIIKAARTCLPQTDIRVLSNGLDWLKLTSIAIALRDTQTVVELTRYPCIDINAYKTCMKWLQFVGINTKWFSESDINEKHMRRHRLTMTTHDITHAWSCCNIGSVQLTLTAKPFLWFCPTAAYSWLARKQFDDIPTPANDCYVAIDHEITEEELKQLQQPASFCANCKPTSSSLPWCKSMQKRSEW